MERLSRSPGPVRPLPLLLAAAAALLQLARGQPQDTYFVIGDQLLLRPRPADEALTSAIWTHNKDLVLEWGPDGLVIFGPFRGRTVLDMTTGEVRINDTTEADVGEFTVEINKRRQTLVHKAVSVKKVPTPWVMVRTLSCSPTSERCVLSCEGNSTGAQPLTYSWRWDSGPWGPEEDTNQKTITSELQGSVRNISCRMKNPVSEAESEPVPNPLYRPPHTRVGLVVGSIFGVLAALAIGVGVWKRKAIKKFFSKPPHDAVPTDEEMK